MKALKYITIFLFFSCILTDSYSQTYHPFPDSSAIWRMILTYSSDPDPSYSYKHAVFISNDTIINGNIYHKLYKSDVTASDTLSINYTGAIREINKKVYLYLDSLAAYNISMGLFGFCRWMSGSDTSVLNKDLLLYDFDVNVGDTVFYEYLDSIKIEITSIDSILIQNQYRKRYHYNFLWTGYPFCNGLLWNYDYYIESIGSPLGIFGHLGMYFENNAQLLCFEDSEISYPDSTSCSNAMGINEKIPEENVVLVYPNPNNGLFTLKIDAPFSQATLAVFDVKGKRILQQNITQTETQLNLLSYPKGMYFYQVIVEEKVFSGKVMVN